MTDYECPDCGGGFPAAAAIDDVCPWCGEAMDGADDQPITPTARPVTTAPGSDLSASDLANPFDHGTPYDLSDAEVPDGPMTSAADRLDGGDTA